ncbi:MAG: glycosyltransferase family 2 protein [Melioribacteraceae bacterium]
MISVIIIQYNNNHLTKNAIESFLKYHKNNFEIILVDNNSTEPGATNFTKDFPDLKIILSDKNLGFGAANNLAAQKSSGDILLFLNNDVIIISEFIKKIEHEFNKDSSIGIIGPKLLNQDKSLQLSCGNLPSISTEFLDKILYSAVDRKNKLALNYIDRKFFKKEEKQWVTGAALFITRKLFLELNGFDESFFMYFEDKDLCARAISNGKKVLYFPESFLIHLRGGSFSGPNQKFLNQKYRESQLIYYKKHKSKLEQLLLRKYLKFTRK